LNDDDALELMKKTLPSAASFVQIQSTAQSVRHRALQVLRSSPHHSVQTNFIALALRGQKVGFAGVIKMVDNLVATLKAEQTADDKKKAYCEDEFDKNEDKTKSLTRTISDTESAISKSKEDIAALKESIEKLTAGIKALDKTVAEATAQRKAEHAEYSSVLANDSNAKQFLGFAKNRLQKFYNPKLYKEAPKRKLSEEEQITVNMGGTLAPTAAPGGIAGTGVGASFLQVEAHSDYQKQDSSGAIRMLDMLIADLDKEITTSQFTEKDAQEDYEQAMKDAQVKRATDSKSLAQKQSEKADAVSSLEELTAQKKSASKELLATQKYKAALHAECDFLLQYFSTRKEARASEMDSLSKAKAVLSGADYSFLQVGSSFLGARK